jgi:hypothetical protein
MSQDSQNKIIDTLTPKQVVVVKDTIENLKKNDAVDNVQKQGKNLQVDDIDNNQEKNNGPQVGDISSVKKQDSGR